MPNAGTYLVITDNTTTCTFGDGANGATNYVAQNWVPKITRLRPDQLGGRGPYEDITEDMPCEIKGTSAANCLANIATLERLLRQAESWSYGDNVTAVEIRYSPRGATVSTAAAPLHATILGSGIAGAATPRLELPLNYEMQAAKNRVVTGCRISFTRIGEWLENTAETLAGSAATSGTLDTSTWVNTATDLSPVKVQLQYTVSTGNATIRNHVFFFGQNNSKSASPIAVSACNSMTATGYTSVADAANLPAGNVLRYTPTGTTEVASGTLTIPTSVNQARRLHFYATLRNNSATITFQVRVNVVTGSSGGGVAFNHYTSSRFIDTSIQEPRVVYLGSVSLQNYTLVTAASATVQLLCTASGTGGSPTLDFDQLVITEGGPVAQAIEVDSFVVQSSATVAATKLFIDPLRLSAIGPVVYTTESAPGVGDFRSYYGDAMLYNGGTKVYSLSLVTVGQYWRWVQNGAARNITPTHIRTAAYLTPQ